MKLADDRFYHGNCYVSRNGVPTLIDRYSYETHDALYDIDVYPTGERAYKINCHSVDTKHAIHNAIEKHFNLN